MEVYFWKIEECMLKEISINTELEVVECTLVPFGVSEGELTCDFREI